MVRILGINPAPGKITLVLLEKNDEGVIKNIQLEKDIYKIPQEEKAEKLINLKNFIKATSREYSVDRISLLKAGTSQFTTDSSERHYIEATAVLSTEGSNIEIDLIPPQTITSFEKKNEKMEIKEIPGMKYSSKDKTKAANTALYTLKKQG